MKKNLYKRILWLGMILGVLSSCSVSRHLDDSSYLLDEVKVISEHNQKVATPLKAKVRQHPNTRTFGLIRLPLRVYCLAGTKEELRSVAQQSHQPRLPESRGRIGNYHAQAQGQGKVLREPQRIVCHLFVEIQLSRFHIAQCDICRYHQLPIEDRQCP